MANTFIQTLSGGHFDYLSATEDDIHIEDIAAALSNICRFCGHVPKFYSVAQHSVCCSYLVPSEYALEALLHDASEAYCTDIPSPLKALLPEYRDIENRVDSLVRSKFGLPLKHSPEVKTADLQMLAIERRDIVGKSTVEWDCLKGVQIPDEWFSIKPLSPKKAQQLFLSRYKMLIS